MMLQNTKDRALVNAFWMYGNGEITRDVFLETIEKLKHETPSAKPKDENRRVFLCSLVAGDIKLFTILNSEPHKIDVFDVSSDHIHGYEYTDADRIENKNGGEVWTSIQVKKIADMQLGDILCSAEIPNKLLQKFSQLMRWHINCPLCFYSVSDLFEYLNAKHCEMEERVSAMTKNNKIFINSVKVLENNFTLYSREKGKEEKHEG